MTKLQIKQRLMELLEKSWGAVWPSPGDREALAESLSTRFRPADKGEWEIREDQEKLVDHSEPSKTMYVVHRGDHEPYKTPLRTEATAVAEVLTVLEAELRSGKNPS
jgi:hypothetical protein